VTFYMHNFWAIDEAKERIEESIETGREHLARAEEARL
jgi:hypothetical protein